jgi:hypothetical protein
MPATASVETVAEQPAASHGDDATEVPPLQCDHYLCRAEDAPAAAAECGNGFARCCGCCAPDWDSAWEAGQEW